MYLKAVIAVFVLLPVLAGADRARADEYLIISNLPSGPKTKAMRELIEPLGEIKSIKCYDVGFSTGIRGSCNVLMWSTEKARKVIKTLNGNLFRGRKLYSKEIYPVPCPDLLA